MPADQTLPIVLAALPACAQPVVPAQQSEAVVTDPVPFVGCTDQRSTSRCPICAYATVHKSWPPGMSGTHCRRCHRTWTGHHEAHCAGGGPNEPGCCQHFSTPGNFDLHLDRGQCVDPSSVVDRHGDPKLRVVERASGPVWVGARQRDVTNPGEHAA